MTRNKLILILTIGTGFAVGLAVAVTRLGPRTSTTITVGELSQRAQEFVEAQRRDPGSDWQSRQLQPVEELAANKPDAHQVTPCFTVTVPFKIRTVYQRQPEECVVQMRLQETGARLSIAVQPFDLPLREHTGIKLRETMTATYQPVPFNSPQFPGAKTFRDSQEVSFFTLQNGRILTVVFSETNDQEKIIADFLPPLLDNLVLNE